MRPLGLVLALSFLAPSGCDRQPTVPMPERSASADFAIVNRTAIDGFGEVYVLVHVPTRQCFVVAALADRLGEALTATDASVCATYTRVEGQQVGR